MAVSGPSTQIADNLQWTLSQVSALQAAIAQMTTTAAYNTAPYSKAVLQAVSQALADQKAKLEDFATAYNEAQQAPGA
jgi:hypothetical protein